ncbi:hypothetical protein [Kaarinaea lacus]
MNDRIDKPDNDEWDKNLSQLYQQASQEQPAAHVDAAILAAARREVQRKPKAFSPFTNHWMLSASIAAVVVLSVSVVTVINKQSHEKLPFAEDTVNEKLSESTPSQEPQESLALAPLPRKQDRSVATTAPQKKKGVIGSSTELRTPAAAVDESEPLRLADSASKKSAKPRPAEPSPQSPDTADAPQNQQTQPQGTEDRLAFAPAETKPEPKPKTAASEVAATPTAPPPTSANVSESSTIATAESQSAPVRESSSQQAQTVVAESAAASIAEETPPSQNVSEAAGLFSSAQSLSMSFGCNAMNQQQCLQSPQCILERLEEEAPPYHCRQAQNECEFGFLQYTPQRQSCEAKPNCKFVAANCYCPPGDDCQCQGGTPAQCVKR